MYNIMKCIISKFNMSDYTVDNVYDPFANKKVPGLKDENNGVMNSLGLEQKYMLCASMGRRQKVSTIMLYWVVRKLYNVQFVPINLYNLIN